MSSLQAPAWQLVQVVDGEVVRPSVPRKFIAFEVKPLQVFGPIVPLKAVPVRTSRTLSSHWTLVFGVMPPSSLRAIALSSVPSVRSVQLSATMVPVGSRYWTVDCVKRVEGLPAPVEIHALYVPGKPPASARMAHFWSAPLRPPRLPSYRTLVANT